jgi:hypothetical protein
MLKMCLISSAGIFEYILDLSREVNMCVGSTGVCFTACINCVVFLNVYGRGVMYKCFW